MRQLVLHTALSHTRLAYSSKTYRRAIYCSKYTITAEDMIRRNLWEDASKPVSDKHRDPVATCLLCGLSCHANIRHHHLSCPNPALLEARLNSAQILEKIARSILDDIKEALSESTANIFRKKLNTLFNEIEDVYNDRTASHLITASYQTWSEGCTASQDSSIFATWRNRAYKSAPLCCEWGLISFNPQDSRSNSISEGLMDLVHMGVFPTKIMELVTRESNNFRQELIAKKVDKEEAKSFADSIQKEWHRFSATTKERCITMQSTITAALVQKARKQGREEKIAIKQMKEEEESNSENDNYVPETISKESQRRGEAPTCNGKVCKVNKALGISG